MIQKVKPRAHKGNYKPQEIVIWTQVPETVPRKKGSIEGDTMRKTQRPGKEKQVTREGDRSQQT